MVNVCAVRGQIIRFWREFACTWTPKTSCHFFDLSRARMSISYYWIRIRKCSERVVPLKRYKTTCHIRRYRTKSKWYLNVSRKPVLLYSASVDARSRYADDAQSFLHVNYLITALVMTLGFQCKTVCTYSNMVDLTFFAVHKSVTVDVEHRMEN